MTHAIVLLALLALPLGLVWLAGLSPDLSRSTKTNLR